MNKQSFTIPEGCKAVTVEQVGNQIITTFEPVFKRGDVLITKKTHNPYESILVYGSHDGAFITPIVGIYRGSVYFGGVCVAKYRHATLEEAQPLWDALVKIGKRWNPETMQVEEIKKEIPRVEKGCTYWTFDFFDFSVFPYEETNNIIDKIRYKQGRYFLSKDQAQRSADKLKSALDEYWKEELK